MDDSRRGSDGLRFEPINDTEELACKHDDLNRFFRFCRDISMRRGISIQAKGTGKEVTHGLLFACGQRKVGERSGWGRVLGDPERGTYEISPVVRFAEIACRAHGYFDLAKRLEDRGIVLTAQKGWVNPAGDYRMELTLWEQIPFDVRGKVFTRFHALATPRNKGSRLRMIVSLLREKSLVAQPVPGLHQGLVYLPVPVPIAIPVNRIIAKVVEEIVVMQDAAAIEMHQQNASEFLNFER